MIEDCFNLIDNNGKCVIKGKIKGKEICYTGSYPMDILGSLHWDDLISPKYFEFIEEKAIEHINTLQHTREQCGELQEGISQL